MSVLSPFYAIAIFTIAIATGYLINIKFKTGSSINKFEAIDGLRGLLAVSVFICHSSVWYKYIHTGLYVTPPSNLFKQLGESSVTFFFMISSFLFMSKLLETNGIRYNWVSFYIKRLFRLLPLHFFLVLIILVIIFTENNWIVNQSYSLLIQNTIKLLGFGIIGVYPINSMDHFIINAGVIWTLSYEWMFYFSLPIISLFILKKKPSALISLFFLLFILFALSQRHYDPVHFLSFIGGMIAPIILKYKKQKINFNNHFFTAILLTSLVSIAYFHFSIDFFYQLLVTIPFTIIALGNDIYGLLKKPTLKLLGDISYSTYLIHGILIFITIHYIYGINEARSLTESQYSLMVFLLTPFVILFSMLTYKVIEKPFIQIGKQFTGT